MIEVVEIKKPVYEGLFNVKAENHGVISERPHSKKYVISFDKHKQISAFFKATGSGWWIPQSEHWSLEGHRVEDGAR